MSLILGLETSCDETAAAVVAEGRSVRSSVVASQHDLHAEYGGVVPEIASRAHLERLLPVVESALREARVTPRELDAIAVGNRPGLVGSLIVGVSAAKALAWALGKPLIGVDHVQAHLYAAVMGSEERGSGIGVETPYPALGLVVSGGHTSMYVVESPLNLTLLGRTIDDAVGEAYDKAAVILGLPYPGGPNLDTAAQRAQAPDPEVKLPRSMLGEASLDFSFSGLKTALLYAVRGFPVGRGSAARFERSSEDLTPQRRDALARAFQEAAVATLITKLGRGLHHMSQQGAPAQALLIGGGVSANSLLRRRASELGRERGVAVLLPEFSLCVDNAAMIAGLAHQRLLAGQCDELSLPVIATTAT